MFEIIEYYRFRRKWRHWKLHNTFMLVVSMLVFFSLLKTPFVDGIIRSVGSLGYAGAFFTGMLFVSTFTVAPAMVVLYHLAGILHPAEVAVLAGLGAMVGDYIIFRYVKDRVFKELKWLFRKMRTKRVRLLFRSPYFAWMLPVAGAAIIASPFPDEVGVGMLGMSKIKRWQFYVLSFTLNATGIFLIVSASRL